MPATQKRSVAPGSELPPCNSESPTACTASRHATAAAYDTYHCRCPEARAEHNRLRNRRHLRLALQGPALIDATGTCRRLRALASIGYSVADLAREIGTRPTYVSQLQHVAQNRQVHRDTASRVYVTYNRLADCAGPSPRAVHYARRNGWLAPLWWDDDTIDDPHYNPQKEFISGRGKTAIDPVVVERLIDGQPPLHVTKAERAEAVRILDGRGWTHSLIAQQLAMSGTRVVQILDGFVRAATDTPADSKRQESA